MKKKDKARAWKCTNCETVYGSTITKPEPSSCRLCGGVGFERLE